MKKKVFFKDLDTVSACIAKALKFCADIEKFEVKLQHDIKSKDLWLVDSCFVFLHTIAHLAKNGKHSIMMAKTADSRLSKNSLKIKWNICLVEAG